MPVLIWSDMLLQEGERLRELVGEGEAQRARLTTASGASNINTGRANFHRCSDCSTTPAAPPSIHRSAAASSWAATPAGSSSKCSRLKPGEEWMVIAGSGEMPFCWLSAIQAIGPASSESPPGGGSFEGWASTAINAKQGS